MNQDELRPDTSKCSRLEKRRLVSQNHQRQEQNIWTSNPQKANGMTLDQYFKGGNFKVIEINEEEWDTEMQRPPKIPILQTTNFRIKTGKKRQETLSNKKLNQKQLDHSPISKVEESASMHREFISPHPPQLRKQFQLNKRSIITQNDFFRLQEDRMRKTNMELKYGKMREQIFTRFGDPEQELIHKYAEKFNIYDPNPPKLSLAPKDIYAKLK